MNYLKLAAAVVVLAVLAWIGNTVNGWRKDAAELPGARAEAARIQSSFNEYRRNTSAEVVRVNSIAQGYQHELETLRADRGRPISLRVPNCTAAPRAAAVDPAAAPGAVAAASGTGGIPEPGEGHSRESGGQGEGIDIGPDIEQLARDADAVTAIARGLQAYVRTLPAQCLLVPPDS